MPNGIFRIISDAATGAKARALQRLSLLPRSETGKGLEVPLPFRDREDLKAGLTDKEIDAVIDAAPIVDVPLQGLTSLQHSVQADVVRRYIVAPGATSYTEGNVPRDVPIVVEREGMVGRYLWDGNHRVTAAILRGESSIRARLAKLPAETIP